MFIVVVLLRRFLVVVAVVVATELARCNIALSVCLRSPIRTGDETVRQMTDRFIRVRAASLDAHPNIILRGQLWHDCDQAYDGPDNMHVGLGDELDFQREPFYVLAWRVAKAFGTAGCLQLRWRGHFFAMISQTSIWGCDSSNGSSIGF